MYYDSANQALSALAFLDACPVKVEAHMLAVLDAVAEAPPPQFSGGGKWEAMHGTMGGYFEVRATGPNREQFRLFCILENADDAVLAQRGLPGPAIAVITGMRKPWRTVFAEADYRQVRDMGNAYLASSPRRIVSPPSARASDVDLKIIP